MKRLFVLAIAALAVCCHTKPTAKSNFTITGTVLVPVDSVWLFAHQDDQTPTVGAAVQDGAFRLEGYAAEPSLGVLITRAGVLCQLVVEPGNITVKQTGTTENDIEVTGTEANDAVTRDFARLTAQFKKDSVQCHDEEHQQQLIIQLWQDGAKSYSANFAGVLYVMNLMDRIPADELQALYDGLSPKMKATKEAIAVSAHLRGQQSTDGTDDAGDEQQ